MHKRNNLQIWKFENLKMNNITEWNLHIFKFTHFQIDYTVSMKERWTLLKTMMPKPRSTTMKAKE